MHRAKNMKWSEEVWKTISPIYNKILTLPFIDELTKGILSEDRFLFYISQDSLYLNSYVQVLSHIASRIPGDEFRMKLLEFAADGINVEKSIHKYFLTGRVRESLQSPACMLYTSFLKSQAYSMVEVEMASVLPCFWVYQKVGEYILAKSNIETNPYRKWIETYADKQFAEATRQAIIICDQLAFALTPKQRELMTEAFIIGTKMEFLFWDSAYKKEQWII